MYFRKSNYNCDFDINSMKVYMLLPIDKTKNTEFERNWI